MIPKTSTDSVCGIAVRGQQEFFNGGIPKHLLYWPSLNVHCVQMHVAERQSIPNLPAVATQAAGLPQVFAFDSLKSLPHRDYLQPHYESPQQPAGNFPLGTCSGDNTACVFLCVPSCTKHMFVSWLGLKDWLQHCMQIPAQDVHVCIHACMHVGLVCMGVYHHVQHEADALSCLGDCILSTEACALLFPVPGFFLFSSSFILMQDLVSTWKWSKSLQMS